MTDKIIESVTLADNTVVWIKGELLVEFIDSIDEVLNDLDKE